MISWIAAGVAAAITAGCCFVIAKLTGQEKKTMTAGIFALLSSAGFGYAISSMIQKGMSGVYLAVAVLVGVTVPALIFMVIYRAVRDAEELRQKKMLVNRLVESEKKIKKQQDNYKKELSRQQEAYQSKLAKLKEANEQELVKCKVSYERKLSSCQESYERKIQRHKSVCEKKLGEMDAARMSRERELLSEIDKLKKRINMLKKTENQAEKEAQK